LLFEFFVCAILQDPEENLDIGIDYMVQAADAGDRGAMIYVAKAFETGDGLGKKRYSFTLMFDLFTIINCI
jgi:elongation factor 2 kinase